MFNHCVYYLGLTSFYLQYQLFSERRQLLLQRDPWLHTVNLWNQIKQLWTAWYPHNIFKSNYFSFSPVNFSGLFQGFGSLWNNYSSIIYIFQSEMFCFFFRNGFRYQFECHFFSSNFLNFDQVLQRHLSICLHNPGSWMGLRENLPSSWPLPPKLVLMRDDTETCIIHVAIHFIILSC